MGKQTAIDVVRGIQKLDIAWFANLHPISVDQQQMEALENMESQTVERFYRKYLESNGNSKFRIVVLGVWTVDLKKHVKMLTEDQGHISQFCILRQNSFLYIF